MPNILKTFQLNDPSTDRIDFEYHGKLYFGWADCVLLARDLQDKEETPEEQILRMEECIKIAHVFLGICESFEQLMLTKIYDQVGGYLKGTGITGDARDLNRLRTLALAVVSLTNYKPVAAAEEDQRYFELFEKYARVTERGCVLKFL